MVNINLLYVKSSINQYLYKNEVYIIAYLNNQINDHKYKFIKCLKKKKLQVYNQII